MAFTSGLNNFVCFAALLRGRGKANKIVLGGDGGEVWLLERISQSEHRAPDTPE
jgi:hypothetical protein